jgi:hypothetical protein
MREEGLKPPDQPAAVAAPQASVDNYEQYRRRGQVANDGDPRLTVNIHIDATSHLPPSGEAGKRRHGRISEYAGKHTVKFVSQVAAGLCVLVLAAWLGINSDQSSSTDTDSAGIREEESYGSRTRVSFTVENSARSGVWALKSPVMEEFGGYKEPPLNAAQWLSNGTVVDVHCARPGTPYEFVLAGRFTRWRFFAELEDGSYVAMAGFRETTEDGAQDLMPCEDA